MHRTEVPRRPGALQILTAALSFLIAACVFGEAQAQAPPPVPAACAYPVDARSAVVAASEPAFQQGLAFAADRKFYEGFLCFQLAAQDGVNWRTGRWWAYSRRPEVWFNMGLAGARVPGLEVQAIAAFEIYLRLQPNVENAPAVRTQMAALAATERTSLLRARNELERSALPQVQRATLNDTEYQRAQNSRTSMIAETAAISLYLGDHDHAVRFLARALGENWAAAIEGLDFAFYDGAAAYVMDPVIALRFVASPSEQLNWATVQQLLRDGDLPTALRRIQSLSSGNAINAMFDYICAARRLNDSVAIATGLEFVHAQSRLPDFGFKRLPATLLFLEYDRSEWAHELQTGWDPAWPASQEEAQRAIAGQVQESYCEMQDLDMLRFTALESDTLASQLARIGSHPTSFDRQTVRTWLASPAMRRARDLRFMHGPW